MKTHEKITVIIGSGGSGKTTAAKEIAKDYSNVIWLDGSGRVGNFFYSRCNEDTELIIIEELKNADNLMRFAAAAIDGVCVEHRGKDPFYINPRIVVVCKPDVKIPMESVAFQRRFDVIDCDM
jgi:cytidylate kinase